VGDDIDRAVGRPEEFGDLPTEGFHSNFELCRNDILVVLRSKLSGRGCVGVYQGSLGCCVWWRRGLGKSVGLRPRREQKVGGG